MWRSWGVVLLLSSFSLPSFALNFGKMRADEVAVYVKDLNTGKMVAEHRTDVAMNPASTMKLVTAFAAFRALGAQYRWQTEFKSDGKIVGDTLQGDIYWVGSGDPVFDQESLIAMQQQLRSAGIQRITGQLVLDRSVWGDKGSADDFVEDTGATFMTAPDPHMLAYKVVWAKPERDAIGAIVVRTNPPLPEIPQRQALTLSASGAACPSLARYMQASYQGGVLSFTGQLPSSCLGQEMFINMLNTQEFAQRSFINQWRAMGGQISDGIRISTTPTHAKVLARFQSKPMWEILSDMNKFSNNLIARTVFLKLGEQAADKRTSQNAKIAVRREWVAAGLDDETLILENGSGLSRRERITARHLGQMLEKAYYSPFRQAFIDGLPIAGTDGTLKTRFRQIGAPLRLKTGTLKNVRALAGYWLGDGSTPPLVIVVLINSSRSDQYLADMDHLVASVVRGARAF